MWIDLGATILPTTQINHGAVWEVTTPGHENQEVWILGGPSSPPPLDFQLEHLGWR